LKFEDGFEEDSVGIQIIEINDVDGNVIEPDWLAKAEGVHRQLRPHL